MKAAAILSEILRLNRRDEHSEPEKNFQESMEFSH